MNKFERYKQALGPVALKFSDDEILRLMKLHELMANVLFDMWMRKRKGK